MKRKMVGEKLKSRYFPLKDIFEMEAGVIGLHHEMELEILSTSHQSCSAQGKKI